MSGLRENRWDAQFPKGKNWVPDPISVNYSCKTCIDCIYRNGYDCKKKIYSHVYIREEVYYGCKITNYREACRQYKRKKKFRCASCYTMVVLKSGIGRNLCIKCVRKKVNDNVFKMYAEKWSRKKAAEWEGVK